MQIGDKSTSIIKKSRNYRNKYNYGNVTIEAAYKDNQADGFDRDKETREMLHDAAALGLGIYQDLIGYEEGVRGNIDREVDEWTSVNQL